MYSQKRLNQHIHIPVIKYWVYGQRRLDPHMYGYNKGDWIHTCILYTKEDWIHTCILYTSTMSDSELYTVYANHSWVYRQERNFFVKQSRDTVPLSNIYHPILLKICFENDLLTSVRCFLLNKLGKNATKLNQTTNDILSNKKHARRIPEERMMKGSTYICPRICRSPFIRTRQKKNKLYFTS